MSLKSSSEYWEFAVGFVLDFDGKNNVLRVTLDGRVTDAIMLDTYATVARYVASRPSCRGIVNVTDVTKFEVSSSAVRQMAESAPAFPAASVRVFIAPTSFIYGMVRMFQMLGEKTRPNLHIVRTLDEAYALLQLESPEFSPVTDR
jgi:hypothetical protein